MYCTYITIYKGNKLPMFYIGSTQISKIQEGYRGSVNSTQYKKIWKKELKYNPHLFKSIILTIHKNRKDAFDREIDLQNKLSVLKKPTIYLNRVISRNTGGWNKGIPMSENTKAKLSASLKGKSGPNKGRKFSEEWKLKISEKMKGRKRPPFSEEWRKNMSIAHLHSS